MKIKDKKKVIFIRVSVIVFSLIFLFYRKQPNEFAIMSGHTKLGVIGSNFFNNPKVNKDNIFLDSTKTLVHIKFYATDEYNGKFHFQFPEHKEVKQIFYSLEDVRNDERANKTFYLDSINQNYLGLDLELKDDIVLNIWLCYNTKNELFNKKISDLDNYKFGNGFSEIPKIYSDYYKLKVDSFYTNILLAVLNNSIWFFIIIFLFCYGLWIAVNYLRRPKQRKIGEWNKKDIIRFLPLIFSSISLAFTCYNFFKESDLQFDVTEYPTIQIPGIQIQDEYSLSDDLELYSFDDLNGKIKDTIKISKDEIAIGRGYQTYYRYLERFDIDTKKNYRIPELYIVTDKDLKKKYYAEYKSTSMKKENYFFNDTVKEMRGLVGKHYFNLLSPNQIGKNKISFHTRNKIQSPNYSMMQILSFNSVDRFMTNLIFRSFLIQLIIILFFNIGFFHLIKVCIKKLSPTKFIKNSVIIDKTEEN